MSLKKFVANLVAIFLLIVGCSYKPPDNPNARPGTGLNFFPVWMDNMLGAQYGFLYSRELPLVKNAVVYDPVQNLGTYLVRTYYGNERPAFNFQFHVVDLDIVNAFALPGGNVYVFRGLLESMDNEAELAAVMSHEMGHTVARHGTKNMSKNLLFQSLLSVGTGLIGREHRSLATAAYIAGSVGLSLQMLKYSRDYEREADWIGVHNIAKAGYNPEAMVTMFDKLEQKNKNKAPETMLFLSTHPATAERRQNALQEIRKIPAAQWKQEQFGFQQLKGELKKMPPAPKELHGRPVLGLTSLESFGQTLVNAQLAEIAQESNERGTQTVKIFVPSNEEWIDTGIILTPGQRVEFDAQGQIQLGTNGAVSGPQGIQNNISEISQGALVGALKSTTSSSPFLIGNHQTVEVQEPSRLYFGIHDDSYEDNSGWYEVTTRVYIR
jgi:hypothetical protein